MRIRTFTIHPPRHPLLRALALILAVVLAVGLLVTGLLLGAAVIATTACVLLVRRWLQRRRARKAEADIIEGEFTVVSRGRTALPPTR